MLYATQSQVLASLESSVESELSGVRTDAVSDRHGLYILSKPYQKAHGFEPFTRKPFNRLLGCYVVTATCFVTRDLEMIIP